ncbi:MAG: hypothetical protein LBJ95_01095 [Oscillospiraceae bacterium]|nr:hypothetical protein [Oscillospiraceae bacterium]
MSLSKKSVSLFLTMTIASAPLFSATQGRALIDADPRTIALRSDENALKAYGLWFGKTLPSPEAKLKNADWVWMKLLTETRAIQPLPTLSRDPDFRDVPSGGEIFFGSLVSNEIPESATADTCKEILSEKLNASRTAGPVCLRKTGFLRNVAAGLPLERSAEFHAIGQSGGGFGAVYRARIPIDAADSAVSEDQLPAIPEAFKAFRPELFDESRILKPWEELLRTVAENPELALAFAGVGFIYGTDTIKVLNPSLIQIASECTLVPTGGNIGDIESIALGQGRGSKITAIGEPAVTFDLSDYTQYQKIQLTMRT